MININIDSKNVFEEYCFQMVQILKEENYPVLICGETNEKMYLDFFEKNEILISNVYDGDLSKVGKKKKYGRIIGKSEIEKEYIDRKYNAIIVVPYFNAISSVLNTLNVKPNHIFYIDVSKFHNHPTLFINHMKEYIQKNRNDIEEVAELYKEEKSKEIFEKVLNYWISGDRSLLADYSENQNNQYLDTLKFSENEVFLNCGACDGKYTKLFMKQTKGYYKEIINVESDIKNFNQLKINLQNYSNMSFYNVGIWNEKKLLNFSATGNSDSSRCIEGGDLLPVDSIDNLFLNIPISFIKMDIEGAEYNALMGGENTIKKYLPKLAVCCYHNIEDLIRLPKLIKSMDPRYKFKLRQYTDTLTETVCYAYIE